jgi:hypothetical protein
MNRITLTIGLILIVVIGVTVVLLGAFPPQVTPHPVTHELSNDQFQPQH